MKKERLELKRRREIEGNQRDGVDPQRGKQGEAADSLTIAAWRRVSHLFAIGAENDQP